MKKKLNVAILIDAWLPFVGGTQKQVQETTKIWQKNKKLEFKMFHSFSVNIFLRSFWCFYVIPQVFYFHFFKKRFDLIHAHAFLAGLPAKILSLILRIPVIFTVHGIGIEVWQEMNPGFLGKIQKEVERFVLFKIKYNAQISVSSDIQKFSNVNKKIFIIPNAVDIKEFDKVRAKKAPGFKMLFVGRLHPQKGIIYLIKAMSLVVKDYPQVILHLVGEGSLKQDLKQQVKQANLERFIKFRGRIMGRRLIKEYKSSHLFVLPSLYEGQPLTLLEAWAAKLPVLVTKVGENPRMVKENENGYLVKTKDIKALTRMMMKAIENPNLSKLGVRGYHWVKKELTWFKAAQKILQVYQKVLN